MAKLIIDGINIRNHYLLHDIAGIAGYAMSHEFINECRCEYDIDEDDLVDPYYSKKVKEMIGEFIISGFEATFVY